MEAKRIKGSPTAELSAASAAAPDTAPDVSNKRKRDAKDDGKKILPDREALALKMIQKVAADDESLIIPEGLTAKSFTVVCNSGAAEDPSSIGVLLSTSGFYVAKAKVEVLNKINAVEGTNLKVNKKQPPGTSIYWGPKGGVSNAWRLAKLVAGWVKMGPVDVD